MRWVPIVLLLAGCAPAGRDCRLARLDQGLPWCAPVVAAPAPGLCTRTLGGVECWQPPAAGPLPGTPIADGPRWHPD